MSDEVTIIPHNKMRLPQKLRQRFPPFVGSTNTCICIFFVVNFSSDIRATKI
uniref:Uncharacterized protein n=1 Tax=Arundo donax TaxID=35708 RepID=A0A0A9CI65_ARUDO